MSIDTEKPIRSVSKESQTRRANKKKGPAAEPKTRTEQNNANRLYGKHVERQVAKRTGGERTPGSGAIKNSVFALEGDVRVRDADGKKEIAVIECKGCGTLDPRGEHSFTLKKSVLDQMVKEADLVGVVGLVYLKWKGANFEDDYVIFKSDHFIRFLELAKLGATLD